MKMSTRLEPDEGTAALIPGTPMTHKLASADTGGNMSVIELTLEGAGPPPHIHHGEDEAFYVLEGEVNFQVGERIVKATEGSFVFGPKDIPHSFAIAGERPAKVLVMFSPAGIEELFLEVMAPPEPKSKPEYIAKIKALAPKYNLELLPPPEHATREAESVGVDSADS